MLLAHLVMHVCRSSPQRFDHNYLLMLLVILQCLVIAGYGRKTVNGRGAKPADAAGPLGMSVGSRAHLESAAVAKRTFIRNFLMHGFHLLVTFVAGHAVKDTQCGFKVSPAAAWSLIAELECWCRSCWLCSTAADC